MTAKNIHPATIYCVVNTFISINGTPKGEPQKEPQKGHPKGEPQKGHPKGEPQKGQLKRGTPKGATQKSSVSVLFFKAS